MKEVYIYNFTHNYKEEYAGTTTHAFDKPLMKYEYDDLLVDSHINAFNIKWLITSRSVYTPYHTLTVYTPYHTLTHTDTH